MVASLLYVGGGRPKPRNDSRTPRPDELGANLTQWLERRNIGPERFVLMVAGSVVSGQPQPPVPMQEGEEATPLVRPSVMAVGDLARNPPPMQFPRHQQQPRGDYPPPPGRPHMPMIAPRPGSLLDIPLRPFMEEGRQRPPRPFFDEMEGHRPERRLMDMAHGGGPHHRDMVDRRDMFHGDRRPPHPLPMRDPLPRPRSPPGPVNPLSATENPIWSQAKALLGRVMQCATPSDPGVRNVVRSGAELRLAEFVAATLQTSITQFK